MSNRCWYCRYLNGNHEDGCPNTPDITPVEKGKRKKSYQEGWDLGRSGKEELSTSGDKAYFIGFIKGVVALEEAENSDPNWGQE